MLLGGLGADVVRVDRVTEVDQPPPIDTVMRRSQRSIAVDMKHPQRARARVRAHRRRRRVRRRVPARRGRAARHRTRRPARPQPAPRVRAHDGLGPGRAVRARWRGTTSTTSRSPARSTRSAPRTRRCRRSTSSATTAAAGCCSRSGCSAASSSARQSGVGQVVDVAMFEGAAMLMTVVLRPVRRRSLGGPRGRRT